MNQLAIARYSGTQPDSGTDHPGERKAVGEKSTGQEEAADCRAGNAGSG
jgi:hypothetical protein